ncbi:hypothetical protein Tco_0435553 [Tanacetum coccineum]
MSMTIQSSVKDKILATSSETSKVENTPAEMQRDLDQQMEKRANDAYRLRLPEELSGVHDTFHVSNLKKCLADASLHMPLDEIKVEKTLRFIEEPVENSDCQVLRLKCSRMVIVKVRFWLEVRSLGLQFLFDELRDRVENDVVTQLKVFDESPR